MKVKVRIPEDIDIDKLNVGQKGEIHAVCRTPGDRWVWLELDSDRFFDCPDFSHDLPPKE